MPFRFVHAADLHLDSPFTGIRESAPHVGETLRRATFDAYDRIIALCIERRADALLVAGDVFDSADRSLAAQIRFVDGLKRLDAAGIRAFICHGNHDPLDGWGADLALPPLAHRFGATAEAVPVDPDSPSAPVVCGISYPQREVRRNLAPEFPARQPGRFTIGLLHANVDTNPGHEAYAPCTLDDLVATGYDYWALGHVHTRAILRDEAPLVAYPGNPQGRHPNERGARGVYVVDVQDNAAAAEFVAVDAVRWEQLDLPIDGIEDATALFGRLEALVAERLDAADGRHIVYRVRLTGRGALHAPLSQRGEVDDLVRQINDAWAGRSPFAFCGGMASRTRSELDRGALRNGKDFVGDFLTMTAGLAQDENLADDLLAELAPLRGNARARRYLDAGPLGADEARELLAAAEDIALGLLVDDEAGG